MSKAFEKWWEEYDDEPIGNEKRAAQQAWNAAMDRAMEVCSDLGKSSIDFYNADCFKSAIEKEKV